jgi:hypothetical protein
MSAVTGHSNPADHPADAAALAAHAEALATAIESALPRWITGSIERVLISAGREVDDALRGRAAAVARAALQDGGPRIRALLATDVDAQRVNPLQLIRDLVPYPTEVLRAEGVPPVHRDEFARKAFPDDDYDLSPAAFAGVDPSLHEPGIVWGAAKAHIILTRRRREGRR